MAPPPHHCANTEDSCRYHHQCCKQRLVRRPCGEALPPYQRESTRNGRSHRQRCSMHRPVPHPCVESVESPTSHQRDTLSVRRRAEATISEAASNAMFLAIATKHRLLTSARARRRAAHTNNDATCTAMFEAHAPKHQRLRHERTDDSCSLHHRCETGHNRRVRDEMPPPPSMKARRSAAVIIHDAVSDAIFDASATRSDRSPAREHYGPLRMQQ